MKILVVNGPNVNLLGINDPELSGKNGYKYLCEVVKKKAEIENVKIDFYQSNREGKLVDIIQRCFLAEHVDGIIFNPGAYGYYSYALYDVIRIIDIPVVEVHVKEIGADGFPSSSIISKVCVKTFDGKGIYGYLEALQFLVDYIKKSEKKK